MRREVIMRVVKMTVHRKFHCVYRPRVVRARSTPSGAACAIDRADNWLVAYRLYVGE